MKGIYFILYASIIVPSLIICKDGYFSIRNHDKDPINYTLQNSLLKNENIEFPISHTLTGKIGKKLAEASEKIDIEKPTKLSIWTPVSPRNRITYIFDPKIMGKAKDINVAWQGTLRRQKGILGFSQVTKKSLFNNVTDKDVAQAGEQGNLMKYFLITREDQ